MRNPTDVHVFMAALPGYGHFRPLKALAMGLSELGFRVTFATGSRFQSSTEAAGIEFLPFQGIANMDLENPNDGFSERLNVPEGPQRVIWDMEHIFFASIPDQYAVVQTFLARAEVQNKKVVAVIDGSFFGTLPILLRAPGRRIPVIGIGHFPMMHLSKDTPPFGMALQSSGPEQNAVMNAGVLQMFSDVNKILVDILEGLGCTKPLKYGFFGDIVVQTPDLFLQLCVPVMEPPRSDLPPHVRFIGTVLGANDARPMPDWFQSFVVDDQSSPLFVVTSGTLPGTSAMDLIIPTIQACAALPIRLVVCTVHAELPSDFKVPPNARVARWIAFDALLPYANVMVTNAGYGGVNQALAAGLLIICAGVTEDKAETSARANLTGAAINLQTQTPTTDQMREAIERLLGDASFKSKALELKQTYDACDAVGSVVDAIWELVETRLD
ncbi:hypothetical protein LTR28_008101 [Elasticomyces elasticus]|nr:hypothetical protein LTR28_008101 [Elasticomyces elasticus]